MRKLLLSLGCLFLMAGLTIAADVVFVKYDSEKKELTVTEGGEEKTYSVEGAKVFQVDKEGNEKQVKGKNALKFLEKAKEGKTKFAVTVDGKKITEIKRKAGGKKKKKKDN